MLMIVFTNVTIVFLVQKMTATYFNIVHDSLVICCQIVDMLLYSAFQVLAAGTVTIQELNPANKMPQFNMHRSAGKLKHLCAMHDAWDAAVSLHTSLVFAKRLELYMTCPLPPALAPHPALLDATRP